MLKSILPRLDGSLIKGESGNVLIVGGSFEYTGAPFFAAMSAFRLGADLVHIVCHKDAGIPIKSYSPDLIVHPLLGTDSLDGEKVERLVKKMHAVVIGPGLSLDSLMQRQATQIYGIAAGLKKPIVLDGDGLALQPIQTSKGLVLTPNVRELAKLHQKYNTTTLTDLARRLKGATIVAKGASDVVTDGLEVGTSSGDSSPRRCGGQGDILAGCVATFSAWNALAGYPLSSVQVALLASKTVRKASLEAFKVHKRAMLASDILPFMSLSKLALAEL